MKGHVAIVTGALSGIGRATALEFARRGASVVASGRNAAAGDALVAELKSAGAPDAAYIDCDVRHEDQIEALVNLAVQRFGRLDYAVNNAGTEGASLPLTEQTLETYADTFDINVRGTLLALKHEMRAMASRGGGGIVNLSSTMARVGRPGLGLYCASKHAVEGLTKVAAIEGAAQGIRVNAIAPGQVDTAMLDRVAAPRGGKQHIAQAVPLKRVGTVEEAAKLILFLASSDASYITGQSVAIDGGRLAM